MKLTRLRQQNCSCSLSLIDGKNHYTKNGIAVLHKNGFHKRIPANGLRVPQLFSGSRSGYIISQENCKSCHGDNDCSPVKKSVPLSCEMESEEASIGSDTCDNNVAMCTRSRLNRDKCRQSLESPSVACHCSTDKSQSSVNAKQQCKSAASLSTSSTSSPANAVCSASVQCKWNKCGCAIASDVLLEHIHLKHVATQSRLSSDKEGNADEPSFVCLWNGCKVYNRPSCSLTWLERHILSHLGDKPYCCIVAGCGARFASQAMLERHVNGHFSGTCSTSLAVARSLRKGDSVTKLAKKRKPRSTRPYPVTSQDYFDSRIMEAIRKHLSVFSASSQSLRDVSGNDVTFQHAIVAKRVDNTGQSEILLHWNPPHTLPEEWVLECDLNLVRYKALPFSCLPGLFAKPVKHSVRK